MAAAPNTPATLAAIQTICQGLQVSSTTFFVAANVITDRFKDITNNVPACEITMFDDESRRYTVPGGLVIGGKIDDSQFFLIEITLDLSSASSVELQLAQIRDSLSAAFMQSATLATNNIDYSGWEGKGSSGYTFRNGQWWRAYKRALKVRYEYNTTMQL